MTETIETPPPAAAPLANPVAQPKPGRRAFLLGMVVGALVMAAILTGVAMFRGSSLATSAYLLKNKQSEGVIETASGLQYKVLTPGKGAKPTDTDIALVTYTGTLTNGTEFDKSQQPTPMPVAGVVPGFSEALKLMSKGAKYRLWIKPELGYGDKASGPIPANSVLVFDVELIDFLPEAVVRQLQMQSQMGGAPPGGAGNPPPPAEQPKR